MQFWGNSNLASDNIIIITKCKYTCSGVAPVRAGSSGVAPVRETNKRLKAFSEEKATEAAKATDLYTDYIHAAVREMM